MPALLRRLCALGPVVFIGLLCLLAPVAAGPADQEYWFSSVNIQERVVGPLTAQLVAAGVEVLEFKIVTRLEGGIESGRCIPPAELHIEPAAIVTARLRTYVPGQASFLELPALLASCPDPTIRVRTELESASIAPGNNTDARDRLQAYLNLEVLVAPLDTPARAYIAPEEVRDTPTALWQAILAQPRFSRGYTPDGSLTGIRLWFQEISRRDDFGPGSGSPGGQICAQGMTLSDKDLEGFRDDMMKTGLLASFTIIDTNPAKLGFLKVPLVAFRIKMHLPVEPAP